MWKSVLHGRLLTNLIFSTFEVEEDGLEDVVEIGNLNSVLQVNILRFSQQKWG